MPGLIRGTNLSVFDRGFDIKVSSQSERPKRKAQFSAPKGLKTLDWRFRAALAAVSRSVPTSDRWVKMTIYHLAGVLGMRTNPPGFYRAIQAAHKLYQDHSEITHRLESLILTGESDITIAAVLHMSRHTIRAYRKVFYDIDAIAPAILKGNYSLFGLGALDQYARWDYAAINGGLDMLLQLWTHESKKENGDAIG